MILHRIRQLLASGGPKLLPEGTRAPDFRIHDESGNEHSLSQYRGKRVLLWWFIRASTPG
jgi:thioredoxin-dependent peroxiredoxin